MTRPTSPTDTDYPPVGSRLTVSVETMADALGVRKRTAYDLLWSGAVESRLLGRRRLVNWRSLCDYIESLPTD